MCQVSSGSVRGRMPWNLTNTPSSSLSGRQRWHALEHTHRVSAGTMLVSSPMHSAWTAWWQWLHTISATPCACERRWWQLGLQIRAPLDGHESSHNDVAGRPGELTELRQSPYVEMKRSTHCSLRYPSTWHGSPSGESPALRTARAWRFRRLTLFCFTQSVGSFWPGSSLGRSGSGSAQPSVHSSTMPCLMVVVAS